MKKTMPRNPNQTVTTRIIFRRVGDRWLEIKIELTETRAYSRETASTMTLRRLSIVGSEGVVTTMAKAREDALQSWVNYFEDDKDALAQMALKYGNRTAKDAALTVVSSDGELHGLDVHRVEGNDVFICHSSGQIKPTIAELAPDVAPYLEWHLNDMNAECEHQRARGDTWKTHAEAVCPDCGYKLGTKWLYRELPDHVIAWVKGLP